MPDAVDVDVSTLPANVQEMIRAAVAQAISTYHPGEAPPPEPETPEQTAKRLLAQLETALHGEQAIVSGSGRIHETTYALLASLVAGVFPEKSPNSVVEAAAPHAEEAS